MRRKKNASNSYLSESRHLPLDRCRPEVCDGVTAATHIMPLRARSSAQRSESCCFVYMRVSLVFLTLQC